MSTPKPPPYALLPHPAVFLPDEVPRRGRLAFWSPEGAPLPDASGIPGAEAALIDVVRPHGRGVRTRVVPAVFLPVAGALPLLVRAARSPAT
ncbi:hypothetical protein EF903_22020, partial [Streptomyces sp. WAC05292]|uniref:hypothetical protein n=1 Tax=Streptomyces sp. WAC05292 TaxID=2487418 RepID=UPI000F9AA2A0